MRAMICMAGALLVAGAAHAAPTAEQKCEGGMQEAAAKYSLCRAKADKKLATAGDAAKHGESIAKCNAKLASAWQKLEAKATKGGTSCSSTTAVNEIQSFVSACTDSLGAAVAGGALPSDVESCNQDLTTCDQTLTTCGDNLSSCETDLAAAKVCGNGAIDAGEDCDLGTLNGASCASQGFAGGVLACTNGCVFDTDPCYTLRFADNADGTITDNHTGLMWEKKVKLDGSSDGANLQDANNTYRWAGRCSFGGAYCQPTAAAEAACLAATEGSPNDCSQCASGVCETSGGMGITAWQWLTDLNAAAYGGYNDWRLPTKSELLGLIDDRDPSAPAVNVAFHGTSCGAACTDVITAACACTQSDSYWSATPYGSNANAAWLIRFSDGLVHGADSVNTRYVRGVRGGS
ncbi:MAG TPA: DUF1566 domain-containing protein [Terriglobales bacterium]|nr:DUF1566 domain-containing protein [Terriglobales bacterium]